MIKKNRRIFFILVILTSIIIFSLPIIPTGTLTVSLDLSSGEEVIEKSYLGGLIKKKYFRETIITENWPKVSAKKNFYLISKTEFFGGFPKYISLKSGKIYYEFRRVLTISQKGGAKLCP